MQRVSIEPRLCGPITVVSRLPKFQREHDHEVSKTFTAAGHGGMSIMKCTDYHRGLLNRVISLLNDDHSWQRKLYSIYRNMHVRA